MELKRFAYKIDLFFKSTKLAQKIVEVPIDFKERSLETSKFSFKEMIASYKVVILLRIQDSQRLIKFGIVGFTGFLVNYFFIRVLRNAHATEFVSWLVATELAIISNFTFNNIWTFKEKKISGVKDLISKFLQFNLTSGGALVIQSVFGPLGTSLVGEKNTVFVLAAVVAFLVLPYNYLMYNLVIWKTWKNPFAKKKSSS
jgi:dolichol-phosphate mannosyltransferase